MNMDAIVTFIISILEATGVVLDTAAIYVQQMEALRNAAWNEKAKAMSRYLAAGALHEGKELCSNEKLVSQFEANQGTKAILNSLSTIQGVNPVWCLALATALGRQTLEKVCLQATDGTIAVFNTVMTNLSGGHFGSVRWAENATKKKAMVPLMATRTAQVRMVNFNNMKATVERRENGLAPTTSAGFAHGQIPLANGIAIGRNAGLMLCFEPRVGAKPKQMFCMPSGEKAEEVDDTTLLAKFKKDPDPLSGFFFIGGEKLVAAAKMKGGEK